MAGNSFFPRCAPLLLLAAMLSCTSVPMDNAEHKNFSAHIEDFALEISTRVREFDLDNKTIGITTFVELDNFENSSSFGRFISEQLASELYKLGFHVRELRQRIKVETIQARGEFALTRDENLMMKKFQIDALLAGSYSKIGDKVVVSARLINRDTSHLVSVGKMTIDLARHQEVPLLLDRDAGEEAPVVRVFALEEGMAKK